MYSRWSEYAAYGTGKSSRAKLVQSGCRLRRTPKGRLARGFALVDTVVDLEEEKDRDTARGCAATNPPNLRRGDRKHRIESRYLCRDAPQQATPRSPLRR